MLIATVAGLGGIGLAWIAFGRPARDAAAGAVDRAERVPMVPPALARFWLGGWGFDTLYDALFVKPFVAIARWNRGDLVDLLPLSIAGVVRAANAVVRRGQTGKLRWYAAALALGAIVTLALVVYA